MRKQSIRTWKVVVLAVLVLLIYGPEAKADTVVLTFEGLGDNDFIGNFYNGGAGGSFGISFSSESISIALISVLNGGSGNFTDAPSGDTAANFLVGVMNVPAGFTAFSFFYSAADDPGVVSVWSGLNATGTMLGELSLPINGHCAFPNFCFWTEEAVNFTGTAESVQFGSSALDGDVFFDNVTVTTPEPSTMLVLAIGSLGLAGLRRKKAA